MNSNSQIIKKYLDDLSKISFLDIAQYQDQRLEKNLEEVFTFIRQVNDKTLEKRDPILQEIIKFYFMLYAKAIELDRHNIQLQISIQLSKIFKIYCENFVNMNIVEYLLDKERNLFYETINLKSPAVYRTGYHWYFNNVFDWIDKKSNFSIDYVPVFNKYLFNNVQLIIDKNMETIFNDLVSFMHHGVGFHDNNSHIYDYADRNREDLEKIAQIDKLYNKIVSKNSLEEFIKELDLIREITNKTYEHDTEQILEKNNLYSKIKLNAEFKYKFYYMKRLIFSIGSYCLFRNKYQWIKYIWEYKQPSDSRINWVGHDIYPTTINDFLVYINTEGFSSPLSYSIHHHDNEQYDEEYRLYFLSFLIHRYSQSSNAVTLPSLKTEDIISLKYQLESLNNIIDSAFSKDKMQGLSILPIGIDSKKSFKKVKRKVSECLESIIKQCEDTLSEYEISLDLSQEKQQSFIDDFVSDYSKTENIKDLFNFYHQYFVKEENNDKVSAFGMNTLAPRDIFFEDWHVSSDGLAESFSSDFTRGEDNHIITQLIDKCKPFLEGSIENLLEQFDSLETVFMIIVNQPYSFIQNSKFKDTNILDPLREKIDLLSGYYMFKAEEIPIFEFYINGQKPQLLIFDSKNWATLQRYNPDLQNSSILKEQFSFEVIDLKDKPDILQKILKKRKLEEDEVATEEKKLLKQVNIQIYEKFDVVFDDDFIGYSYLLIDD